MAEKFDLAVERTLCMKLPSPNIKPHELKTLCVRFGTVVNVKLTKGPLAFVTMDTIENCHKALEGLANNTSNIKVELSKGPKHKQPQKPPSNGKRGRDSSASSVRSNAGARPVNGDRASRGRVQQDSASSLNPSVKEICLKKIPRDMTQQSIELLCGFFAKVESVRMKDQCAFVKLASLDDFNSLMNGLKGNQYGIIAEEQKADTENLIHIKAVPPNMDWQQIKLLCGFFGNVVYVERKEAFCFVKMASASDFEGTIQGLKNNRYGMIAEPAGEPGESKTVENAASSSPIIKPSGKVDSSKQNGMATEKQDEKANQNSDDRNKCMVCKKQSSTVCQRCGDFYCSPDCQSADWQVHRYVCIAKPKLVSHDSAEIGVVPNTTAEVPKLVNKMTQADHQKAISKAKLPLSCKPTTNVNSTLNLPSNPPKSTPIDVSKNSPAKPNLNNNSGLQIISTPENIAQSSAIVQNGDCSRDMKNGIQTISSSSTESFSFNKFVQNASSDKNKNIKPDDSVENRVQKEFEKKPETEVNMPKKEQQENQKQCEVNLSHQREANDVKPEEPSVTIDWSQNFPKRVCITAYCKSNFLWVRLLEKQQNDEYIKIMDKTNSLGRSSTPLQKLPKPGDLVITDYEDKILCRAQTVHVINETNIIVRFLDIGPLQTKELKQLRKFPDDLPKTGNFILAIKLFQVPDFKLNSEAISKLNSYMRNTTEFRMNCYNKEKEPTFILRENCTNENFNELMLKFKAQNESVTLDSQNHEKNGCSATDNEIKKVIANSSESPRSSQNNSDTLKKEQMASNDFIFTPKSPAVSNQSITVTISELVNNSNHQTSSIETVENEKESNVNVSSSRPEVELESNIVFTKDIQWDVLPNEEYVNVYVADNSLLKNSVVSCINLRKLNAVKQFNQEFDDYARTLSEPHTPRTSEICLAINEEDQKWYRAELLELLNMERASLKFIDVGCVKEVSTQNIRKYAKDLLKPCHTSTCTIAGLTTPLDEKIISSLQKLFPLKGKAILDLVEPGPDARTNLIHIDLTEL